MDALFAVSALVAVLTLIVTCVLLIKTAFEVQLVPVTVGASPVVLAFALADANMLYVVPPTALVAAGALLVILERESALMLGKLNALIPVPLTVVVLDIEFDALGEGQFDAPLPKTLLVNDQIFETIVTSEPVRVSPFFSSCSCSLLLSVPASAAPALLNPLLPALASTSALLLSLSADEEEEDAEEEEDDDDDEEEEDAAAGVVRRKRKAG